MNDNVYFMLCKKEIHKNYSGAATL